MERIGVVQRRARLGVRHHLAPTARAPDVVTATRGMLALHGTDPATVYLSAWARVTGHLVPELEKALYDDRVLIRMLGMRRTMFVLPVELAAGRAGRLHPCDRGPGAAQDRAVPRRGRRHRRPGALAGAGRGRDPGRAPAARHRPSTDLSAEVPELAERIVLARGKAYEATQSVASRVLPLLAADGVVVRGRPRGSWLSGGQYWWSVLDEWLPGGLPELEPAPAQAALARAWLRTFGPAPATDLKWWSGWTLGQTRRRWPRSARSRSTWTARPGWRCPTTWPRSRSRRRTRHCCPCSTRPRWAGRTRGWYLGPHGKALFDTNGNAGPTVWWDGRIVGGWAQRKSGEIVLRFLEDAGADATAAAEEQVARLQEWLGPARITPRFRTPLERELVA